MNKTCERERNVFLKADTKNAEFIAYKGILQKPEGNKRLTKTLQYVLQNSLPGKKIKRLRNED